MKLESQRRGEMIVIQVMDDRIDAAGAIQFKERMRELIAEPSDRVVLDMSNVGFLDSSGLGAVVSVMKAEAANRANFMVRVLVRSLTPLAFAQQVVSRYNEALGRTIPVPRSCAEFLELGKDEGIVTVLEL